MKKDSLKFPLGVRGMELKVDTTRAGFVDDGLVAWPERVIEARRQWLEVPSKDFELVGRRRWRDRGSGLEYREANGCPLLSIGTEAVRFVSAFFVLDGRIVFLERADVPQAMVVYHGEVIAREMPSPAARVIQ